MFLKLIKLTLLLILICSNGNSEIINKIEIDGNIRISDNTIKVFIDYDIGDNIELQDTDVILKNLYETMFFQNVSVTFRNNILNINLIENPIIENISYNGIKADKILEVITKNLSLRNRSSFNKIFLEQDKEKISTNLKTLGYYFSSIDVFVEKLNDNKVNVEFRIDLGEKAKIKKISFIGNKIYKDSKLRSLIISEEYKFWKFLSGKKFLNESIIEIDERLLKNFYLNNGYYNVNIFSTFAKSIDLKENTFELIFNIEAGERIFFNTFSLNLPNDYDPLYFEPLQKIFKDLKDKPYSINSIEKIIENIDITALNEQYEAIDIKIDEKILDENKLDIAFTVDETEKFIVRNINILGNNVTQESVIRNQFEVDEGDFFNNILLNKTINNIKSLNFFKTVTSDVVDAENDEKIINITIEEKPTGEIYASAGVGTSGNSIGFGVSENNFIGKGIKLDSNLTLSTESIKGSFSATNPNFMNSDKLVYTSLDISDIDRLSSFGYKTSRNTFSLGSQFEYLDDFNLGLGLRNSYENIETDTTASDRLKKQQGDYFDSILDLSFDYDKRNQKFKPSDGFRSRYNVGAPLISDTNTITNTYNFKYYMELFNENISTLGFYANTANSLTDDDVKITDRVFIPQNNLRGFEYGKIGPKDNNDYIGGNYASTINFTSTLPFILQEAQNTEFMFFIDAGNVWGVDYDSSLEKDKNKIRSSTGLGVDWFTPIGPLSFSLSKPITKADTDKTESFRFNLGTTF
jgi:outer membrane protein insertion porin family